MSDHSPLSLCKVSTTNFYPSLVGEKKEKFRGLVLPVSIKSCANFHTFEPTKETYEHLSQTRLEDFKLCTPNEQKSHVQQTMEEPSRMDRQRTNQSPFHAGWPEIHKVDEAHNSFHASLKHGHPKAGGLKKHSQHLHPSLYYFIGNSIKNCSNLASSSFRSIEPSALEGKNQQRDPFRFLPYSIPFRAQESRPTEGFLNEKNIEKVGCVRLPESRKVSKSQGTREEARQKPLGHANIIQDSASNSTNCYQRGRLALDFPQTPSRCSKCMTKALPKRVRKRPEEVEQVCVSCSTDNTPEWRRGPTGPRTLCNACGLQFSKQCLIKKKLLLANGEYIKGINEGKVDDFTAEEREDSLAELRKRCSYLRSLD